jgi:23S rRNA pseudouridine955/2504/2580 synthase
LLLAKTRPALVGLHRTLRDGEADKRYLVLVKGKWRDAKRSVELPLTKGVVSSGETRVRVDDVGGKASRTVFYRREVLTQTSPPTSLLEAELHTGRTHQIRVHLAHLHFPVAGDDKYGDFAWNKVLATTGLKRMFLHAYKLGVDHPVTGRRLQLESSLPAELTSFLDRLARAIPSEV